MTCTLTQDDVDDSEFTEYNEGFVAYMFGHFLYENPYNSATGQYCLWHDGWNDALKTYPEFEPKESIE